MATALQRQLAQISANSTQQLDLKAQKTQHAKSLLFEPRDAARQSFDDIYHICAEGFEELSQLDSRLNRFANNLFSEGSKDVDRGQLTKAENEELDAVIERYLGLVQGRLLLKPAQKSLEWLVRRFRVHEFNTETLLLTFLPYHTDERIFPTVLALLPTDRSLPDSFKWLYPYIASFSCPPRHAVLAAAISNRSLYSAFNSYVLRVARAGYASSLLLGYWAALVAQAVNGMLDSSRTGRDSVRRQREEDVLLKVLPVLQEAFSISKKRKLDEMFVGACMVATILATKASLSDNVLDAMTEAVASSWTNETIDEGISCLAAVVEEKDESSLPTPVVKKMLADQALASLLRQSTMQRTSKLSVGLALGALRSVSPTAGFEELRTVRTILEADILHDRDIAIIIEALISESHKQSDLAASAPFSDLLTKLLESERLRDLVRQHNPRFGLPDEEEFYCKPGDEPIIDEQMEIDYSFEGQSKQHGTESADFKKTLDALPELPSEHHSFLNSSPHNARFFEAYSRALHASLESQQSTQQFLDLTPFSGSGLSLQPALFTLLARIWSTRNPQVSTTAKIQALRVMQTRLEIDIGKPFKEKDARYLEVHLHDLVPYLLTALANEIRQVRIAAANCCRAMQQYLETFNIKGDVDDARPVRGAPTIYYTGDADSRISIWSVLDSQVQRFLQSAISPVLEDCVLDAGHIMRHLTGVLNGVKPNAENQQRMILDKDLSSPMCTFLASHACYTPILRLKVVLLRIIGEVDKEASHAREQILVPSLKHWAAMSDEQVRSWCDTEGVKVKDVDTAMLGVLSRKSEDQMKLLQHICSTAPREDFVDVAFERLQQLWPTFKTVQLKIEVIERLLKFVLAEEPASEHVREQALLALRTFQLPSEVAVSMLQSLPSTSDLTTQHPPTKRQRRASDLERNRALDTAKFEVAIRRMTLVLELLETSKQSSPELFKPLFHLLAELRLFKNSLGSELVYLHAMLLDILLAVITFIQSTPQAKDQLRKDNIRVDLLVDCVRSTSSPQIHNAALLIVSALASFTPESVLHSVIPLFTFMSSTVLRRSDEYSAHVTDMAVTRIVPALAESLKKKGKDLLGGVSELLLSFVAAWEHVPLHRRLGLFEMLVRAVGPDDCLGIVAAMLVDRYADRHSSVPAFIVELTGCFEPVTVFKAANQWMRLAFDALQARPNNKKRTLLLSDALLNFSDKTQPEQAETMQNTINGLASLLQNASLRERTAISLAGLQTNIKEDIQSENVSLTEQTIRLAQFPEISSKPVLKTAANNLLLAVLGLLPTSNFIASCAQLMQSGSSTIREQVFRSLESRVESSRANNIKEREIFLDVLPSCAVFISQDQPVEIRMAAVSCIDSICDKFGKSDRESVKNAATKVASDAGLGADDNRLRILSVLCLASIAGVLGDGDESASIFPDILARTLDLLESPDASKHGGMDAGEQNVEVRELKTAVFRLLTALLDHTPWILASGPTNLHRAIREAARNQESNTATEFRALAARQISAAEYFGSMESIWSAEVASVGPADANHMRASAVTFNNLLNMLHQAIQHHTKATIAKNASRIFSLLLKAFDVARQLSPDDSEGIGLFEEKSSSPTIDQLALDVTLKMNDATFRPFFNRLVEWSTSDLSKKDNIGRIARMKSLYSFALLLFEKLKSLVTSYTSFLLDNAGEVLRDSQIEAVDPDVLELVVKTLGSSFRHDEDEFWTAPAHFDIVAQPLVSLLGSNNTQPAERLEPLISTITDLATAVSSSPERLKAINSTLLSLLRHEQAHVRLAAVQCERAITKSVSFDWLALLPELLPAISELQEDDDERVEQQTLLWVREIEEISGESLEGMLA